jgi:hypothetical protein
MGASNLYDPGLAITIRSLSHEHRPVAKPTFVASSNSLYLFGVRS